MKLLVRSFVWWHDLNHDIEHVVKELMCVNNVIIYLLTLLYIDGCDPIIRGTEFMWTTLGRYSVLWY